MNNLNWRLGLDLGTNSIGWSVFSLDKDNEVLELVDLGVRIFSDGRDSKTNEPLAVSRRIARGQRKSIYRRKLRRKQTFRLLQKQGLFPKDKNDCMELKGLNPYELRIKALDEKLTPFELGRVLFNLSVRRGFKSNRKDGTREEISEKKNDSEIKSQSDMQTHLEKAIQESGYRTLGEYLYKNQKENKGIRFVPGRMTYYPTRKMYEQEFNEIRNVQEKFYKDIDWDEIYKTIFTQRPLKPQPRGYCIYMKEKERTYKAMPCSQKLRILQDIRNLAYYDEDRKKIYLNDNQDSVLYDLLNSKEKVTFDQMRKALKLNEKCTFNLEENRDFLNGNATSVKMRSKNRFGKLWDELPLEEQDNIIETIFEAEEDIAVYQVIEKYNLTEEQKDFIVKNTVLPGGTAMLCKEVSEKLVKRMEEISDLEYDKAVSSLGFTFSDQKVEQCDVLPYYGKILAGSTMGVDPTADENNPEKRYGKISNPTVHVALNQTRVIVNNLIKVYGKPSQIAVELSRDLKNSVEKRAEIARKQNERAKQNVILNKNITELYSSANLGKNILSKQKRQVKIQIVGRTGTWTQMYLLRSGNRRS